MPATPRSPAEAVAHVIAALRQGADHFVPLLQWKQAEAGCQAGQQAAIRLLLPKTYRDAEGEPPGALALPGIRLPVIHPGLAAAVAATAALEARP